MDQSVDDLFELLKQQAPGAPQLEPRKELPDELQLEDPAERDAQLKFEEIDRKLQKLPKLRTEFDALAHKKHTTPAQKPSRPPATEHKDWFLLPKPDKTARDRAQRDLLLLQHRAALDPKRHYKKDRWRVPERFALGTVLDGAGAGPARAQHRGATMLDSLLTDQDSQHYFKRKYAQIQQQRSSSRRRAVRKRR